MGQSWLRMIFCNGQSNETPLTIIGTGLMNINDDPCSNIRRGSSKNLTFYFSMRNYVVKCSNNGAKSIRLIEIVCFFYCFIVGVWVYTLVCIVFMNEWVHIGLLLLLHSLFIIIINHISCLQRGKSIQWAYCLMSPQPT